MSTVTATKSFCVICDAEPGGCSHNTHRYLEDIVYTPGPAGGWIVPEHERARWDAAPLTVTAKQPAEAQARDIEDLVLELADVLYLDPPLEQTLRSTHDLDPLQVTRLAAVTVQGATSGQLTSPGGFLVKRLGQIQHGKTKAP